MQMNNYIHENHYIVPLVAVPRVPPLDYQGQGLSSGFDESGRESLTQAVQNSAGWASSVRAGVVS